MRKRIRADLTLESAKSSYRKAQEKLAYRLAYVNDGTTIFNDQQLWQDVGAYKTLEKVLALVDRE